MIDNELIANFMDQDHLKRRLKSHLLDGYTKEQFYESLSFHDSWDWIMPVWIKFRDLEFIEDSQSDHDHRDWINSLEWYLFSSDEPKRFAERLVYAIKWYNSQKA